MTSPALIIDAQAELGEGPLWHQGVLWWVDVLASMLHRWDPLTQTAMRFPMPRHISCVMAADDGLIVGLSDGVYRFRPDDGSLVRLAGHDVDGHRLNDGKVSPDGRLFVGSLAYDQRSGTSFLYRMDGAHLIALVDGVSCSNGLAWSSDGRTLYYVDTGTGRIDAFTYDQGRLSDRRPIWTCTEGWPDGMTIDAKDQLWVALWGVGMVKCIDPTSGAIIETVHVPARQPTCCTFGGDDFATLYITSARTGLQDLRREDGALFSYTPRTAGRPTSILRGVG